MNMKPAVCKRCAGPAKTCSCGRQCCAHLISKTGTCGPCNLAAYNARRAAVKKAVTP